MDRLIGTGTRKTTITIHESVNEMGCIVTNITLDFYHGGLHKVKKVVFFKVALVKDEIVYHEC